MSKQSLLFGLVIGVAAVAGDQAVAQEQQWDFKSIECYSAQGKYLRRKSALTFLDTSTFTTELEAKDARFKEFPGLADANGVSFESVGSPGHCLRHQNGRLKITLIVSDLDKKDATFMTRPGLATNKDMWVSLELYNYPGSFICNKNGELWTSPRKEDTAFLESATFRLVRPVEAVKK